MGCGKRFGRSRVWHFANALGGTPANRRRVRQPVAEVGKGSGKDDAVGYDTAKTVMGHKVHALVDAEGLPLRVVIHSAAIQDSDGAALIIDKIRSR